jgi:ethanolamine permease
MSTTHVHDESEYLAKRTLKRGTAGWVLLAGLGVSYVISGDYSGWNFGLAEGGFGGLLIAGVVIAGMYLAIALAGLLIFAVSAIGSFDTANLTDIAPTDAAGASSFLPFGYLGIWAAVPFAIWFFLAVEGVPLAAEEAKEPERNVPKGIIAAMGMLLVTGATVLFLTAGAGGAEAMSASGNPLVEALGDSVMAKVVNYIGLAGLVASFFSIIYAYSRQLFALSRAGYLPKSLSVVNSRKAPTLALVVPGVIGFGLSLTGQGAMLLNMAVFGAALSYVLMMVSHIVLRVREPNMPRPYRTPGGIVTTSFAFVVATLSVVATFVVDSTAALWCLVVFAAFMAYFGLYSRHRLVANSPDEEFAALAAAEDELQ